MDFIHQQVDKRVILVCAAAGYGKTTLLADFANDSGLPICWYSLDSADSDPRTFFDYFLLSIRQRYPQFGQQTESLLASLTDVSHDINSVVASLVNEIQSDIPDYFLLVLDDFHAVEGSEVVNSALDLLIYYLPDNCHLVVSTRSLPSLTFSRLAALRQIAGLGTGDLRFTADESAKLLRENYKLALPAQQAEEMIKASEGWITGILLSARTVWTGLVQSTVKPRGAGSALFDYLANEAYLHQPSDVRRFLLCSSVLDRMNPELCDELFAQGSARETLQYLVRANLFTEELEGEGEWYRYHNLFQAFLQSKLKASDRGLHTGLHQTAATMAEAHGEWDLALSHYQEAGAADRAADLVERVGEQMIHSGRWQTLYRWLDSLPAASLETRPDLGLLRGRTYIWSGELDKAISRLESTAHRYSQLGANDRAGSALVMKGEGLRLKGQLTDALVVCEAALSLPNDERSKVPAESRREIGICLATQGRLAEADAEMQRSLQVYEALGDSAGIATLSHALGLISVRTGDLARGLAMYQRSLSLWENLGNTPSAAEVLNCIAMVYFYTGEYQKAIPILDQATSKASESGYLRIQAWVLSSIGDVRRDSGELSAAQEIYESALGIAQRVDEAPLSNYLLDGLANVHRLQGDYATAERLLRQALYQAESSQSHHEVASYLVSAGVLAEEQGDLARAEEALRRAMELLSKSGARRDLARARFHLARTLFARGDLEGAAAELESSLSLCSDLGYDQFMVAEGQRAEPLLTWAIGKRVGDRRLELIADRLRRAVQQVRAPKQRPRLHAQTPVIPQIRVCSFGHGTVTVDSRQVTSGEWAVEKTKELFFYLLMQPRSLRKEQIVDGLWPDLDLGKSNSQFHSTVYRLRRAVFPQCVLHNDGRYQLSLGTDFSFDFNEFTLLLDEAESTETTRERRIQAHEEAITLYEGPFLDGFYSDWVYPIRDTAEERYLRALMTLARLKATTGSLDRAIDLLRSALKADPYQEDANYELIHYAGLMGDRTSALRQYRTYVELLRDELGAKPSPKMASLADSIASGQSIPPLLLPTL